MEVLDYPGSPSYPRRRADTPPPLPSSSSSSSLSSRRPPPLVLSPSSTASTMGDSPDSRAAPRTKADAILRALRRKRNMSSSSDNDGPLPHTPTTPPEKPHLQGYGFPKVVKVPLTPISKSLKPEHRSWRGDHLIGGKYAVTSKDKDVLERISQRVRHRGSRIRKPHEVFVELEELRTDGEGLEWEETARWIKFEEDVEGKRWGRPHISALTFHSLVALRKTLESGCVLLDVEGDNYPTIVQEIVQSLVLSGMLPEESVEPVTQVLYMKHKHKSNITLWEKLKKAAASRDNHTTGAAHDNVHHLNIHTSSKELESLEEEVVGVERGGGGGGEGGGRGEAGGGGRGGAGGGGGKGKSILRTKRVSSEDKEAGALLGKDHVEKATEISPSPPPIAKQVLFNLGSSSSFPPPSSSSSLPPSLSTAIEMNDVSAHAQSQVICSAPDIESETTHLEMVGENGKTVPIPNPPLSKIHHHGSSGNSSDFLKGWSELGLMDKIPEDSESLTVLVGGVKFLKQPVAVYVRLAQSHLLGDLTEVPVPVRFIYLLLGPQDADLDYHEVGRAMATLMSDKHFHEAAYSALQPDDLLDAIDEFLDDSIVLPPGDWDENLLLPVMHQRNEMRKRKHSKQIEHEKRKIFAVDPLKHSRRPFGGVWSDIKKLVKRYPSDIRDIFHFQIFLSILFVYITLLAPAIAFGGLMEEVTGNRIGETETLLATGLAGTFYGLAAVQPLTVVAFTGPLLLFEELIFTFSSQYDIPFLEWRAVIGLWLMVILAVLALSEVTFLVHYFSRFSDEIFTGIIGIFFAYEATKSIIKVFKRNPFCGLIDDYPCTKYTDNCLSLYGNGSNSSCIASPIDGDGLPSGFRICNQPNTALWSMLLCLLTFFIALMLRKLRRGKFLGKKLRRIFSDFSMFSAISITVLVAYFMSKKVTVETLLVPSNYQPSCPSERGWFINPFIIGHFHTWEYFAAIIPAALLATLIFIENQLACILVNKAEHKLKKEVGYHYDLLLVAILNGVCGIMGIPWVCGASVRSLQHIQALSVYSAHNAPGEKPKLLKVHEQRFTNVVVHMLILATPMAYVLLEHIPISVVLGVFYYLAFSSLSGVQMFKRTKLLFMPPKHHPDVYYVRKVRTLKMHLFTVIQLVLLSSLWGLKLSPAGMVYPVAIVSLIPIRWVMGKFLFTQEELEALDSEEDYPEDYEDDEQRELDTHVPY